MGLKLTSVGSPLLPFAVIEGQYLSLGRWYTSANTFTAGPIAVTPGTSYTGRGGNRFRTRWETSSGTLISGQDLTNPATITTPTTITAPANASKLYVYYANATGHTFEITEGSSFVPLEYSVNGSAIYGPFDLSSIEEYDTSLINWTSTTPANTALTVKTAVRNDSTTPAPEDYQTATDGQVIPNFTASQDLSISKLWIKVEMATTDDTVSPEMTDLSFFVSGVGSQYKIQINLTHAGKMKYPQGDITIAFTGLLVGVGGGFVEPFTETFTPVGITPIFNPNAPDHLTITSNFALAVKEVVYSSAKLDEPADQICIYPPSMALTITHVGTLPL